MSQTTLIVPAKDYKIPAVSILENTTTTAQKALEIWEKTKGKLRKDSCLAYSELSKSYCIMTLFEAKYSPDKYKIIAYT